MSTRGSTILVAVFAALLLTACATPVSLEGSWRAWLDSPGGELPFALEFSRSGAGWAVVIVNGPERIDVPEVRYADGELELSLPHYDSRIVARLDRSVRRFDGEWSKRSGPDSRSRLAFHATAGAASRFIPIAEHDRAPADVAGRWSVDFSEDDQPAVAVYAAGVDGELIGTFMTVTGDYRYLAGSFEDGRLRLSCFDGAHAFLFDAELDDTGTLAGDFWSRDTWHETWTAVRNEEARLPDAFTLTRWTGARALDSLVFPDLDGIPRSLADPEFAGRARLLQVFGSWCPNCNDASAYMAELDARYRDRGLSIVGLAFEMTGDHGRDAEQVRRYAERHGVEYPLLVAGLHDKAEASRAFPVLDRVRSYPTTIFMDGEGNVRAIHTGFTGPATGAAYDELRREFDDLIEELLAEPAGQRANP